MVHECWVESFGKEGYEDSLVNYPVEVDNDFEFIDVGEDFILDLGNRLEMGEGFCLKISGKEDLGKGGSKVGTGPELLVINGIRGEGYCPS